MAEFIPQTTKEDKQEVIIRLDGIQRSVSLSVATLHWLAHCPQPPSSCCQFVAFSLFVPDKSPHPNIPVTFIRWTPDAPEKDTITPDWVLQQASKTVTVPNRQWVPVSGEWSGGDSIAKQVGKRLRSTDADRQRDIDTRTEQIQQQGTDEVFVSSLEYYTTQRVKMACVRMNKTNIGKKIDTVTTRLLEVAAALDEMSTGKHEAYEVPTYGPESVVDSWMDDPSAPCCPTISDFLQYDEQR